MRICPPRPEILGIYSTEAKAAEAAALVKTATQIVRFELDPESPGLKWETPIKTGYELIVTGPAGEVVGEYTLGAKKDGPYTGLSCPVPVRVEAGHVLEVWRGAVPVASIKRAEVVRYFYEFALKGDQLSSMEYSPAGGGSVTVLFFTEGEGGDNGPA